MNTATPLQIEFREILQHVKAAQRLADDTTRAALETIEAAIVDTMFDNAI